MAHFEVKNIFTTEQHTFRKNPSCDIQLVPVIEDWASGLDKNKLGDMFILVLENAFDAVPYELFKTKLFF